MKHKLFLLTKTNVSYRQLLSSCQLPQLHLLDDDPINIQKADIWLAEPDLAAPILSHAYNLKWLQSTFAGIDPLVKPKLRKDYKLTNIRGIFGPLMSEYLFGYLLAHSRQHQKYKQQQQQKIWQPSSFKSLQDQTLLLLGTGSIAQHIAKTAKHFGMQVVGINRSAKPAQGFNSIDTLSHLNQYIPHADTIASILPNTTDTQNILNEETLALMKPNAILFNLGRGNVLDLDALFKQLSQHQEQQAILDVFNQEPLPKAHPIWSLNNVTITPHIAAPSFPEQVVEIFVQNYSRWINSKTLLHQIDFEKGY
ncbi:D-2-hydroxyacid dehydrogenase [Shewanella surugensis]|uniref:D-2-hydroxyacid dehydrogenase n=1 Tax=Shewanella surugensis TaxID=212020 RepID=A0ABT0LA35_9GAMM|nr:D-2-hydroxyacid dehydrogenase [Shewanella surugensis]MCL1124578.1 D-2-hydroxyacid dehydrogenase [Shewanella surugensis]